MSFANAFASASSLSDGNKLIHQAELQRGLRIDHISGVEHLRGLRRPHELRQKKRTAIIRKQSDLRKFCPNTAVVGRESEYPRPAQYSCPLPPQLR